MAMQKNRTKKAFSLAELIVTMAILFIGVLGSLSYHYLSTKQMITAKSQMVAGRTAALLLEDWKSTGGTTDYNPVSLGLGFQVQNNNAAMYTITLDEVAMDVTLITKDIAHDAETNITLREIKAIIDWTQDGIASPINYSLGLSTYVRVDASGG